VKIRLSLVSVVLLAFVGCNSSRVATVGNRHISYEEVQEAVQHQQQYIHSLHGEGKISVETPDMAQSGSFTLFLRKPDSVLVKLQGPFGIKVGFALITRDEFIFYNSFENKLIRGAASEKNISRILHVRLSFDDMLNLLGGGTFFEDDRRTPDDARIEEDQWTFIYKHNGVQRIYWIDPITSLIGKIQQLDTNGKLILEQRFSNFQSVDGTDVPFNIRITQPREQQMLSLVYSDVSLNTADWQFTFSIPSSAEQIRW
jgi:outer membrane lipoprotein-sorting protein